MQWADDVLQDELGDEPAAMLLKRIEQEKKRLAKIGEIRDERLLSPIKQEELPFDPPRNWMWARLRNVTSYIQRGKSPKYASGDGVPVISQKCVQWDRLHLEWAKAITPESLESYEPIRFLRDGDLLWNSTGTGTIGRVIRVDQPDEQLVCDSHVTVVRCLLVDERFVRAWLSSDHVYGTIEKRAAGATNQVELTAALANSQITPIPPLAEQHRIVAKVDELMALCNELEAAQAKREKRRDRLVEASLARLTTEHAETKPPPHPSAFSAVPFFLNHLPRLTTRPAHIHQLRQSILNLAVRGRLIPQDPNDEPAFKIIERIQMEKTRRERQQRVRSEWRQPPIDERNTPFTLPSGWTWARFPELGIFRRGRSKHRPRNDPSLFEGGTYLFVQTGDVARSKGLIETFTGKYNEVGLAQSATWPKGTLCVTIAANIADSGILGFDACFPDSVVGFVPAPVFPNARYFEYFIRTVKAELLEFAPATAQKNINLGILNEVLIPLPPLTEQNRIVAKVDELMALCDELDARLAATASTRHQLLEATLHESLAGAS